MQKYLIMIFLCLILVACNGNNDSSGMTETQNEVHNHPTIQGEADNATKVPLPQPTPEATEPHQQESQDVPDYITIRGQQFSTALSELDLSGMSLTDEEIVPLRYMTNLQFLNLGETQFSTNQISCISTLAGLTNLERLVLRSNLISDITPLGGLTNLTWLDMQSNQISDLTPLAGLMNLTLLDLWNNQIMDITPLTALTNLHTLSLGYNQISDWSPVVHIEYVGGRPLTPTDTCYAHRPHIIPSIDIMLDGVKATLTNVYEFCRWHGFATSSLYFARGATVTFYTDAVTSNGQLHFTSGRAYRISDFSAYGVLQFYLAWDSDAQSSRFVVQDALPENAFITRYIFIDVYSFETRHIFCAGWMECNHQNIVEYFECTRLPCHSRLHVRSMAVPVEPPLISSITVRPPLWDVFPKSDLTISLTNVFDFVNGADACNQSGRWYYLTPEGSVRFNRDVVLSFLDINFVETHTLTLPAGEILYVRDFTRFGFYYGTAVFDEMPYTQSMHISFIVTHDEALRPMVVDMSHLDEYGLNSWLFLVSFWRVGSE